METKNQTCQTKSLVESLKELGFVHDADFNRYVLRKEGVKPIFLTSEAVETDDHEILASVNRQLEGRGWAVDIGNPVIYVNSHGVEISALVTEVFGPKKWDRDYDAPSVNVVFVSLDENRTDSTGRQIERTTSVVHKIRQYAHGSFWKLIGE